MSRLHRTPASPWSPRAAGSSVLIKKLACGLNDDVCGDSVLVREAKAATGARKKAMDHCTASLDACSCESFDCMGFAVIIDPALPPFEKCFSMADCAGLEKCLGDLGFPVTQP